jgi:hypothetical protein
VTWDHSGAIGPYGVGLLRHSQLWNRQSAVSALTKSLTTTEEFSSLFCRLCDFPSSAHFHPFVTVVSQKDEHHDEDPDSLHTGPDGCCL